jgi:CheY-like chemotaxis protein
MLTLYGGSIRVESRLNQGSTFTCRIPQETGNPSEIKDEAVVVAIEPPEELSRYPVLIADDEEYNRLLLKTILKKWNMPFEEAVNGIDAIEKLKSNWFKIALLDIRMPGIDGLKAARFIRETLKKQSQDLPLIAITAAHSAEECEAYKKEGFDEVVQKPFSENELLRIIIPLLNLTSTTKHTREITPRETERTEGKLDFSELYHISNNDEVFVREMLDTFIKSYQQGLKSIDEKLDAQQYFEVAEVAHKICSPCRHLGANELWRLTKKLESECKNDVQNSNISKLVASLKNEFSEVEKQINRKLNNN